MSHFSPETLDGYRWAQAPGAGGGWGKQGGTEAWLVCLACDPKCCLLIRLQTGLPPRLPWQEAGSRWDGRALLALNDASLGAE